MRSLAFFSLAAVVLCGACVKNAEERTLADLQNDLTEVQRDHDRFDKRLGAVDEKEELGAMGAPKGDAGPGEPRGVRQLNPDGSEVSSSSSEAAGASTIDDDAPRPVIKVQGAPGGARRKGGGDDVIEQTMPDETVGPPITTNAKPPSALDPEAKRTYDAALALVNAKQYDKGLEALAAFLVRYPDHPYAANATYWRGECYFAQGEYVRAAEQFEGILARYALGNKTPDALLKLGLCYQKLGNGAKAKTYFDKLQAEYPRSDAAKLIPSSTAPASGASGGARVQEPK
jgi:tol-pal system protein YbgF